MLRHGPLIISRMYINFMISLCDYITDLPAGARFRFGRHLARGGSALGSVRTGADAATGGARLPRRAVARACVRPAHVHSYPLFVLLCDSVSGFR